MSTPVHSLQSDCHGNAMYYKEVVLVRNLKPITLRIECILSKIRKEWQNFSAEIDAI
jgi:hypothetical protein